VVVNGNTVTITIPITYTGPGAAIPGLTQSWNNAIAKAWTGKFGQYNVITHVTSGPQNQIDVPCGYGRAHVETSRDRGTWPAFGEPGVNPLWVPAHEAGHLMGLIDEYDRFSGVPYDGWQNDIMGALGQPPSEQDISDIIFWVRATGL